MPILQAPMSVDFCVPFSDGFKDEERDSRQKELHRMYVRPEG